MQKKRFFQILFGSIFGFLTLAGLVTALVRWNHTGPAGLMLPFAFVAIACLFVIPIELQIRAMRQTGERIRQGMEQVAKKLFDAPATVRPGYDLTVTAGPQGVSLARIEQDVGYTVDGEHNGVRVS